MAKKNVLQVLDTDISIIQSKNTQFISLTDIARYKAKGETDDIIKNWMRNRNTIELLGLWELMNNPNFKPVEFDGFRLKSGTNSFVLTPKKWVESTNF